MRRSYSMPTACTQATEQRSMSPTTNCSHLTSTVCCVLVIANLLQNSQQSRKNWTKSTKLKNQWSFKIKVEVKFLSYVSFLVECHFKSTCMQTGLNINQQSQLFLFNGNNGNFNTCVYVCVLCVCLCMCVYVYLVLLRDKAPHWLLRTSTHTHVQTHTHIHTRAHTHTHFSW